MARITHQDQIKIDRPGTIGQIERLAGIGPDQRSEFWAPFYKPGHDFVSDGMKALRKMITQRVRNNEICMI